jgi:NADH-quinone oxidoreductase subunit E
LNDALQEETLDLAPLYQIIDECQGQRGVLIQVLQRAQEAYGYLAPEVLQEIAKGLHVPLSQVYGVVTFYAQFYLSRRGKHVIRTCDGTACHVRGAAKIVDAMEKELGIRAGETTPDYEFTFEVVYCLGSCGLSPVAVVDDQVVGRLVPEKMVQIVRDLRKQDAG